VVVYCLGAIGDRVLKIVTNTVARVRRGGKGNDTSKSKAMTATGIGTGALLSSLSSHDRLVELFKQSKEKFDRQIRTAFVLVLCILLLGSLVFSLVEEWSFIDGFYFSFVTLTTIGFGDL